MACANPASEWGDLATLAREMHVRKSLISYNRYMDAFIGILYAYKENVHVNFYFTVCATLMFCHKITSVA